MAKSYVAGVLQGITKLKNNLSQIPMQTAYALLQDVMEETPTPPWDSGDLRNSGAAYVGSRLVATGAEFSPSGEWSKNPKTHWSDKEYGRNEGKGASVLSTFRSRDRAGATFAGAPLTSTRNTVSIVFHTDYALQMEKGRYKAREPGSGPGFLSSKLTNFGKRFTELSRYAVNDKSEAKMVAMWNSGKIY